MASILNISPSDSFNTFSSKSPFMTISPNTDLNDVLNDDLCTLDQASLIAIIEQERIQAIQNTRTISSLEAACAKERELRLQQGAGAEEIDVLRSQLSTAQQLLEHERTRTAQLTRTVETIQKTQSQAFHIDNTTFYTEQIGHLTHEIQDMTRQLKDERARSAQHMRTISELEFTMNQQREAHAQMTDASRMEITSLTFTIEELNRELEEERDRVSQNTRAISLLESALARERSERDEQIQSVTTESTHLRMELQRTLQLLDSERTRSSQHAITIAQLEATLSSERQAHSTGTANATQETLQLRSEIEHLRKLLEEERAHVTNISSSLSTMESDLTQHRASWKMERQGLEKQIERLTKDMSAASETFQNERKQVEDELAQERNRVRTLETESAKVTFELNMSKQIALDKKSKDDEIQKQFSDLQNKHTILLQDQSLLERRVEDLQTRLEQLTARAGDMESSLRKEQQDHEQTNAMYQRKGETYEKELHELRTQHEQAQTSVLQLEAKIHELELSLAAERATKEKVEGRAQTEVASVEQRAQETLRMLTEERSRIASLERRVTELEREKVKLDGDVHEAQESLKRKATECDELTVRIRERDAGLVTERDRTRELTQQVRSLEDNMSSSRAELERAQSELRVAREQNSTLTAEHTRVQSTLDVERKRVVTLSNQINELEVQLRGELDCRERLDRSNKDIDSTLVKVESELRESQRVLIEERRKSSELQRTVSELNASSRTLQIEMDRLKERDRLRTVEVEHKMTLLRDECTALHRERDEVRSEVFRLSNELTETRRAKEVESASLQILRVEVESLKSVIEKVHSQNLDYVKTLDELDTQRQELLLQQYQNLSVPTISIEEHDKALEFLRTELEQKLALERESVRRVSLELCQFREENSEYSAHIGSLSSELSIVSANLEAEQLRSQEAVSQVTQCQQELDSLRTQLSTMQQQLLNERSRSSTFSNTVTDINTLRETMNKQTSAYEEELERLRVSLQREQTLLHERTKRVAELEASNNVLVGDQQRNIDIIQNLRHECALLNTSLLDLRSVKDNAENQVHLLTRQAEEYKAQLDEERTRWSQRSTAYESEINGLRSQLDIHSSSSTSSTTQLNISVVGRSDMSAEMEALTRRLSEEMSRSAQHARTISELESRLQLSGGGSMASFRGTNSVVITSNADSVLKEKAEELRKVRRELVEERDRVLEVQRQLETQNMELHRLQHENKSLQRRLDDERRLRGTSPSSSADSTRFLKTTSMSGMTFESTLSTSPRVK